MGRERGGGREEVVAVSGSGETDGRGAEGPGAGRGRAQTPRAAAGKERGREERPGWAPPGGERGEGKKAGGGCWA
jgi:hypothetical protein